MSRRKIRFEFVQKLFLDTLKFPESDDSDFDFDPDECESSSEEEFSDSGEETEDDLSHIDENNILKPIDTSGRNQVNGCNPYNVVLPL